MKTLTPGNLLSAGLAISAALLWCSAMPGQAQGPPVVIWPQPFVNVSTTPDTQRQALSTIRTRVYWLKNATRTAPNYATGGDALVWRSLQALHLEYNMFTRTLNARQLVYGANELAELSAGLGILEEAFGIYQNDLAAGRLPKLALKDMCQVLGKAVEIWLTEFNQDCARLKVGR